MTAFASGEADTPLGHLSCEMRSVNHRYLEISPRLPDALRTAEPSIRELVGAGLKRGKVDVNVRLRPAREASVVELELNRALAQRLAEIEGELAAIFPGSPPSSAGALLSWPGMVREAEPDQAPLRQALLALVEETLTELTASRAREGESLASLISTRLDQAQKETQSIQAALPEIRVAQRTRLEERVAELAGQLDEQRIEQEVALLLQKTDVDEELDRLIAHIEEVRRVLTLDEPVGRRLDFLMQELNREANTLGSKSVDPRMTQASVELKVLVEQIREQVQNIE